jgi:hypothetical protein
MSLWINPEQPNPNEVTVRKELFRLRRVNRELQETTEYQAELIRSMALKNATLETRLSVLRKEINKLVERVLNPNPR